MRVEILAGERAGGIDLLAGGAKILDGARDERAGDALAAMLQRRLGVVIVTTPAGSLEEVSSACEPSGKS